MDPRPALEASSRSLIRTVDALTDDELAAASLLPGWSRAHVVAHVALNGLALAGVLLGVVHDRRVPMYASDAARDGAIEELAAAGSAVLRDQVLVATTEFAHALGAMDGHHWGASFDRVPGGPTWPVTDAPQMRRRELEIHHADLGAAYTRAAWPEDFVVELLDAVSVDHAGSGPFAIRATDLARSWSVGGDGGPVVAGTGADLGWWLTGRGTGEGLSCDAGALPSLLPWRRTPNRT